MCVHRGSPCSVGSRASGGCTTCCCQQHAESSLARTFHARQSWKRSCSGACACALSFVIARIISTFTPPHASTNPDSTQFLKQSCLLLPRSRTSYLSWLAPHLHPSSFACYLVKVVRATSDDRSSADCVACIEQHTNLSKAQILLVQVTRGFVRARACLSEVCSVRPLLWC